MVAAPTARTAATEDASPAVADRARTRAIATVGAVALAVSVGRVPTIPTAAVSGIAKTRNAPARRTAAERDRLIASRVGNFLR